MKIFATMVSRDGRPRLECLNALTRAAHTAKHFELCVSQYTLPEARNRSVERMLDSGATHLFSVDDDVVVPDNAMQLMAEADVPIIAGCVPIRAKVALSPSKFMEFTGTLPLPHLNIISKKEDGKSLYYTKWFEGVQEVHSVGTGCIMIRRDVIEKIGFPWFKWPRDWEQKPECGSDDMLFCKEARDLGYKIHAHGNVRCKHYKEIELSEYVFDEQTELMLCTA